MSLNWIMLISGEAALLLLSLAAAPHVKAGDGEDELKSATVLSFLRYSTWPSASQLTVGVVGRPLFIKQLEASLKGKSVDGRPIQLIEIKPGIDARSCQLIYFATAKKSEIEPALQALASNHVLTVGEYDRFLDYGGMVNLLFIDGHLGFEVNKEALERSGIEISSKLLRFGQIRRRRGP